MGRGFVDVSEVEAQRLQHPQMPRLPVQRRREVEVMKSVIAIEAVAAWLNALCARRLLQADGITVVVRDVEKRVSP